MTAVLLMAKAPVPGQAKTRLGAVVGHDAAADLAAAALLDTIAACADFPDRYVALAGDLDEACRGTELRDALAGWAVFAQEGETFGDRLVHAHAVVDGPRVQIGMDTPQVTGRLLAEVAGLLERADVVLGPADDGGWWVLGLRDGVRASVLAGVPMSQEDTGAATRAALEEQGGQVVLAPSLCDVDTVADAAAVAAAAPSTRFARTWLARTAVAS